MSLFAHLYESEYEGGSKSRNGSGNGFVGRGDDKVKNLFRIELAWRGVRSCSIREGIRERMNKMERRVVVQEVV